MLIKAAENDMSEGREYRIEQLKNAKNRAQLNKEAKNENYCPNDIEALKQTLINKASTSKLKDIIFGFLNIKR
jgi:hypothetical protein